MTPDSLRARIGEIARQTLTSSHRYFIQPEDDDLIELVIERLASTHAGGEADIPEGAISRAVKFAFSLLLYQAFTRDGSPEQERAFRSAQAYLYTHLLYRLHGDEALAEDLTQKALADVWNRVRRVPPREPGAFLYFVLKSGINLANQDYRSKRNRQKDIRLDDEDQGEGDKQPPDRALPEEPRPTEADAERRWLSERVRAIVRKCLRGKYLLVIEQHFFRRRPYKDLARELQCKPTALHLYRFRALKRLRDGCPELRTLIEAERLRFRAASV